MRRAQAKLNVKSIQRVHILISQRDFFSFLPSATNRRVG